jgi:hypothetical protein
LGDLGAITTPLERASDNNGQAGRHWIPRPLELGMSYQFMFVGQFNAKMCFPFFFAPLLDNRFNLVR